MNKRILLACVASTLLGACAKPYVGTPFTPQSAPLTVVALADDSVPESVIAYQAGSTMSNFGLLGALIDAGVQSSRKGAVNEALEGISYDPENMVEQYLIDTLGQQNITAAVVDGPNREKREFLVSYPAASAETQANLDFVVTSFGYMQAGGNAWRPAVTADVRLTGVTDGKTLMENRIAYNIPNTQAGVITVSPNPDYVFANREDMVSNPERLADGLNDALRKVVEVAAGLLR